MGTHPIFESDFDCLTEVFFDVSQEEIAKDVLKLEKERDRLRKKLKKLDKKEKNKKREEIKEVVSATFFSKKSLEGKIKVEKAFPSFVFILCFTNFVHENLELNK